MRYSKIHLELFEQIATDLGRKKHTHANVEKLLKTMGWKHNSAVRASCDYMNWHYERRLAALSD